MIDGDGWSPIDEDRVQYNQASRTDAGESDNTFEVVLPSGSEEYFKKHYDLIITRYGVSRSKASGHPDLREWFEGVRRQAPDQSQGHRWGGCPGYWLGRWPRCHLFFHRLAEDRRLLENTFECIPNEGTNLDNYQINKTYGTLTVTDRSEKYQITLTPNSKSVAYDGTEKSVSGFEALEFEVDGSTYTVEGLTAEARGTDAGEYPVKVSGQAVVIDADGNDVTDQFTVNIDDAKLTIVGGDSDKSVSNLPHTGDSAALYAMGICGVAIAAGAGALFTSRKRNNYK